MPEHPYHIDVTAELPEAKRALAALTRAAAVGDAGGIDEQLAELIKVRASAANRCEYCLALHREAAAQAGASAEQIHGAERNDLRSFDDRTAAAMVLCNAFTDTAHMRHPRALGGVTPMAAAMRHFPAPELASLVMCIIAINAWNRAMIAAARGADDATA